MSFLKKILFNRKPQEHVDTQGLYYHVDCQKCHNVMRVRIDRTYDLNREDGGFIWRKTLVCDKCFNKMETEMTFDSKYNLLTQTITGGTYVIQPVEGIDSPASRGFS